MSITVVLVRNPISKKPDSIESYEEADSAQVQSDGSLIVSKSDAENPMFGETLAQYAKGNWDSYFKGTAAQGDYRKA